MLAWHLPHPAEDEPWRLCREQFSSARRIPSSMFAWVDSAQSYLGRRFSDCHQLPPSCRGEWAYFPGTWSRVRLQKHEFLWKLGTSYLLLYNKSSICFNMKTMFLINYYWGNGGSGDLKAILRLGTHCGHTDFLSGCHPLVSNSLSFSRESLVTSTDSLG